MQNRLLKMTVLGLLTLLVAGAGPAAALEQQAAIDRAEARVSQLLTEAEIQELLASAGLSEEQILAEEQALLWAGCIATFGPAGAVVCSALYLAASNYYCSSIRNATRKWLCYFSL